MAPFMPDAPSVNTSLAPNAAITFRRSIVIISGIDVERPAPEDPLKQRSLAEGPKRILARAAERNPRVQRENSLRIAARRASAGTRIRWFAPRWREPSKTRLPRYDE